eukprot:comp17316_c0_seq1/m.16498 comp17316_c0_seq1/g.16498  ORF comp17316_c0_seq1/g.16498 comp17316_c0_seq1/m.16498 type:complete len:314 (+) comp17316_c0_seq1:435-1376(+)
MGLRGGTCMPFPCILESTPLIFGTTITQYFVGGAENMSFNPPSPLESGVRISSKTCDSEQADFASNSFLKMMIQLLPIMGCLSHFSMGPNCWNLSMTACICVAGLNPTTVTVLRASSSSSAWSGSKGMADVGALLKPGSRSIAAWSYMLCLGGSRTAPPPWAPRVRMSLALPPVGYGVLLCWVGDICPGFIVLSFAAAPNPWNPPVAPAFPANNPIPAPRTRGLSDVVGEAGVGGFLPVCDTLIGAYEPPPGLVGFRLLLAGVCCGLKKLVFELGAPPNTCGVGGARLPKLTPVLVGFRAVPPVLEKNDVLPV